MAPRSCVVPRGEASVQRRGGPAHGRRPACGFRVGPAARPLRPGRCRCGDGLHVFDFAFGDALAAGWPWALALCLFVGLGWGRPCGRGRCFIQERGKHTVLGSSWLAGSIASAADPTTVATLFFDEQGVVFCQLLVAYRWLAPAGAGHAAGLARAEPYALSPGVCAPRLGERDGEGVPIFPAGHVTDLVARQHVWERLILMDGVTLAIMQGKLCYPRACWRITPSYLQNHKSWAVLDRAAKILPCPVLH